MKNLSEDIIRQNYPEMVVDMKSMAVVVDFSTMKMEVVDPILTTN